MGFTLGSFLFAGPLFYHQHIFTMQTNHTMPFLAALRQVIAEPSSMSLTDGDFFFLANNACDASDQLDYEHYVLYTTRAFESVDIPEAVLYEQVAQMIREEVLRFKKLASQEAFDNKPNWRRLTWMLNAREKQQQFEQRQILSAYKQAATTKLEAKPTPEQVAPEQEVATPAQYKQEPLEPTAVIVEQEPEPAKPKYDLTTPLNVKWKKRFRPDWPWYIEETNMMHLTLAQLREIEAEIAAEKAEGINHPNDRFGYIPKGELYNEGFFTFTPNGYRRLPSCTYRKQKHFKENIRNTIAEQVLKGWVKGDGK